MKRNPKRKGREREDKTGGKVDIKRMQSQGRDKKRLEHLQ